MKKTGKWAWVSVGTSYDWAFLGLKKIEITYTSDRAIQIGMGQWEDGEDAEEGEYYGYGFAASLSKTGGVEKTVIISPEDFDWSYSEASDAWKNRIPKSFEEALPRINEISISAVEGGTAPLATNIVVKSLRLIGVSDDTEPVAIVATKKSVSQKGISVSGISGSKINLNIAKAGVYQVDIYAVNGRRLFSEKQNLRVGTNYVSIKGIAKGVAIIRVSGLNASLRQKLIIK